jgi:hypothetical protein
MRRTRLSEAEHSARLDGVRGLTEAARHAAWWRAKVDRERRLMEAARVDRGRGDRDGGCPARWRA